MRTLEAEPRPVGYSATPVIVTDRHGREVATVRSPRKLVDGI